MFFRSLLVLRCATKSGYFTRRFFSQKLRFCTGPRDPSIMSKVQGEGLSSFVTLNDGRKMPLFGLGVFRLETGCEDVCLFALKNGYRMLDTADIYQNEKEVGSAVRKSGLKREDIYVTTKLKPSEEGHSNALKYAKESIKKLDIGYVDLFLIHTPRPGNIIAAYDALLTLKEEGLIRSVGVSNFGVHHLEELRKAGCRTPAINQIEINPFWRQEEIIKYCNKHGITVEGYAPVFRGCKFDHPVLVEMSERYGKTVAQIMIRWSVQKQYITIPKSSNPERILENAQVFDFVISEKDMKNLETFPAERCCFHPNEDPTTLPWRG
ncbi:uncharacterized oxidoreductase YtbE isoform X1 [Nematostella vectensis]|uniref:uncharacterized oxidoreductase YtbE isoform X1 n=1 Tax=Nematostella vectensis TaxID=45351 RepID=UPI0020777BA4|nr:uncharacterized oxidoreductase YtbE isoform X1 [Nematostella vectensis]